MSAVPGNWWARLRQALRLMVGVGDYERYRAHLAVHHPERVPMSEADWFAQRQQARYGKQGQRCC